MNKSNKTLAENKIKDKIEQLLSKCKHFMNTVNSKMNEHINVFLTCQRLDLTLFAMEIFWLV